MNEVRFLPKRWLGLCTAAVVVFILAPLVVVLLVSLTNQPHISLPTKGFSLQWYLKIPQYPQFITATLNSFQLALEASITSVIIGVMTALAVVRYSFRLRSTVNLVGMSPLFIPMVMSGLAILIFFSSNGWSDAATRLYVAHTVVTLPYVIRTVTASMAGFDLNQELAARNLGANAFKAFWYVTLPQLGAGIAAGALFAFIVSLDNVGISIFLVGSKFSTIPVELYSYASYNSDPMAAALSVLMILFSGITIALLERFFGLQKLLKS